MSSIFDPLSNGFAENEPPWPTTPRMPNTPIPNLPRPSPSHSAEAPRAQSQGQSDGLYGKEPQIYGQPEPGLISPEITTGSNGTKYERHEPYLRVRITGLDRNRRDILVKFDAQTNLSNFTGTTYRNVSRSYYEFQQFYEAVIHSNPQTIVPALPLPRTSAPTDEEDDRLVKIMLQRWLTRVCEDPILLTEEELRSFIESDFGYQPTPNTRRKASTGFSLIKRGVPDEDEELQRARFELTKLETQFFDAAKAIDKLSKARKSLSSVQTDMGNKLVTVATTEAHPPLGNALSKLGRAWHNLADLQQAQGINECVIIGDTFGYQGLNARSAKETLQSRTSVLEEYQAAVKATISKRRNIERLKASSNIRPEKVDEALEEMAEADKYEQILARRVDGISQNLHRALNRHKELVTDDVQSALIEHVRSSIMYERQVLRELEALRTDVGNAAKKHVPVRPNGAPRPTVIPPLEDFSRTPIPRPASGPPISSPRMPQQNPPSFTTPGNQTLPQSPLTASSPAFSATFPRSSQPTPTPGAGPSSPALPHTPITPQRVESPPLGGRFVDGTKPMFVKSTSSPLAPAARSPLSPSFSRAPKPDSPLHTPISASSSSSAAPHPLASSATASFSPTASANGRMPTSPGSDLDPLGMTKPTFMSASVRVQPTRPRLDAREAASKLANMF